MTERKFDVFVSYSHSDRNTVIEILEQVRQHLPRLKIWIDHENISPGKEWATEILAAASAASFFLIFGSSAAFSSAWVQREIGIALHRKVLDKIPVVLLAQDKTAIPADLLKYQYIDFGDEPKGIKALIDFLRDQFVVTRLTMDSAPDLTHFRTLPDCKEKLNDLSQADLRFKITKGLDRNQVAVVWGDLFEADMNDDHPGVPKANCILALLQKCKLMRIKGRLIQLLCREHPHIADIPLE